jgi:hypothetical protein
MTFYIFSNKNSTRKQNKILDMFVFYSSKTYDDCCLLIMVIIRKGREKKECYELQEDLIMK